MFSLKRLRLREQRRQPLQKFSQKATQSPAPKTSSTARTAGRSDRAERRFRRQPFILLLVTASSIPLISAENGENSLITLRFLLPPNPLRWASAGTLFRPPQSLEIPPKGAPNLCMGQVLAFPRRSAHSGSQRQTQGNSRTLFLRSEEPEEFFRTGRQSCTQHFSHKQQSECRSPIGGIHLRFVPFYSHEQNARNAVIAMVSGHG